MNTFDTLMSVAPYALLAAPLVGTAVGMVAMLVEPALSSRLPARFRLQAFDRYPIATRQSEVRDSVIDCQREPANEPSKLRAA